MQTSRQIYFIKTVKHHWKTETGLYRDDGLVVLRNMNARGTDKIIKIIIKMFK